MRIARRGLSAGMAAFAASMALGAAPGPARRAGGLDVIVLGAGVSGLHAAWLLEQQGLRVAVIEGRTRVGGRVLTLMDQPGTPEMGFNAMGAGYGRGIDAARRAGVKLIDLAPRMKGFRQELVLGGRVVSRDEWAASAANPLPDDRKRLMPWEVAPRLMSEDNPLVNWAEWLDPKNATLDVSMRAFLRAHGLSDAAVHLCFDTAPYYGTSADDVSALMFEFNDGWGKGQSAAGPGTFAVEGGNQRLTDGMAGLLKGDVLLGRKVVAIREAPGGVTVRCADGSVHEAGRAVCSLPFSTLRAVRMEPGLTGGQATAVRSLPYQPISLAFLTASAPFWEQDGLSPSMWTDGPLGAVLAQRFGKSDDEVTGLVVQARGRLAQRWDRMGREAAAAAIVRELEAVRPAARGRVKVAAMHSWALDPFNAGDWAYFSPGQVSGFVRDMAAPAGRLHFCGEHTATANRGLEGALESAERVAVEILTA